MAEGIQLIISLDFHVKEPVDLWKKGVPENTARLHRSFPCTRSTKAFSSMPMVMPLGDAVGCVGAVFRTRPDLRSIP